MEPRNSLLPGMAPLPFPLLFILNPAKINILPLQGVETGRAHEGTFWGLESFLIWEVTGCIHV